MQFINKFITFFLIKLFYYKINKIFIFHILNNILHFSKFKKNNYFFYFTI